MKLNRNYIIFCLLAALILLMTGCGRANNTSDTSAAPTQSVETVDTTQATNEQGTVPTEKLDLGGETIPDITQTQTPEEESTVPETTVEVTEPQETEAPPATKPPSWGDVWDVPGEAF